MIPARAAAMAAMALSLGLPASAQVALQPALTAMTDPDEALVEELVVTARDKGPAWWTVSNGDSTVYVLGVPSLAVKRMQWDRTAFDRRLAGANAVILPFQSFRVGGLGAVGAAVNMLRLRSATPFETTLQTDDRASFVAVREALGQPAKRYPTHNPLAAGLLLATDYREKNELTTSDPEKLIKHLAEQAGVPVVKKRYELGPLMGQIIRTPDDAGRACFDAVLEQAKAGPEVTRTAARAWAEGDVRGALANERTFERCIALVPGAQAFDTKLKADEAAAIETALKTPGHAIALVPLRPLLAQGGVLDQLRARGLEVKTPGET